MCTVTFLPTSKNNFILTSNRDEQRTRETVAPKKYVEDGIEMLFPKDKLAGGTWIGISTNKRLVCVLNGAFKKHIRKNTYTKSRGVIAKEILKSLNFETFISEMDLQKIEPFTMVIVDWNHNNLRLFELIWDEQKKHFNTLTIEPKIWSSSTLYSEEAKATRKNWFEDWKNTNNNSKEAILNFHHSEIGDKEQSILMKRSCVETVSITSVEKTNTAVKMVYEDVVNGDYFSDKF
jgi:hypothetical protein